MRRAFATTALCAAASLFANFAIAAEPAYVDTAWRNEQGLPQATVAAIEETNEGYVWLGTEGGLARFDGHHFETFDVRKSTGCESVVSLATMPNGRMAVGTKCGVVFVEDGRVLPGVVRVPDFRSHPLTSVVAGADGTLWISTSNGVGRMHDDAIEIVTTAPLTNVASVSLARSGGVWVAGWGLVGRVDGAGDFQPVAAASGQVRAVCETHDGMVWVATARGMKRVQDGVLVDDPRAALFANKEVTALHEGRDGTLYVGLAAGGGVHALDGTSTRVLWRTPHDQILAIHLDRAGGVLFGTPTDGLHRLDRPLFHVVSQGTATREPVWTAFAGASGDLWVGSRAGLTHVVDGAEPQIVSDEGWGRADVLSVTRTRSGTVWAGMRDRLVRVDSNGAVGRTFGIKDGLPDALIGGMLEDRHGRLWVGTGWGLAYRDGERFVAHAPAHTRVRALVEDDGGDLWVACDDGLYVLRGGEPIAHFGPSDGLPEAQTLSLATTAGGMLASTSAGVVLVHEGKVVGALREQEGLLADEVLGMATDGHGRVWFTTNFGIFFLSEVELAAYFDGRSPTVHPRTFGVGDGLPVLECNGATSSSPIVRLANGDIVFPTMRGLVRFDPTLVKPDPAPPAHAVIEGMRLPDGKLSAPITRPLGPSERNMAFAFTAVALAAPSRVRFVHQLEGFDPAPSEPLVARAAYYTNLPPGSYRFRVRGCDVEGACEPGGSIVPVEIAPRIFERRGFWSGLAFAAVALFAMAFVQRTRTLRDRATELGDKVADRTRELARANDDLKAALDATARGQEAVEALLAEIPLPIFVYRDDCLRYVNAAACSLLGTTSDELVGSGTGSEWRAGRDVPFTTKSGREIVAEIWRAPFEWAGEKADLVIARDVTEQLQLEQRAATNERLAALGTLAAGVAHEINNPLSYVAANVEHVRNLFAQNRIVGGDAEEALAEASDGAKRIATIVKGLTTVARAGDDRVEPVDLGGVVSSALNIAAAEIRRRARTEVRMAPGLPKVRGDATRLGQVVLNLLTNAAQSFSAGVAAQNLVVVDAARDGEDRVRLSVSDNGAGIAREHLPKLFDPFFTTKPVGEGTGLGLSVCHGIVRALGGEIAVKSELGVGTTITVKLPVWRGTVPARPPENVASLPSQAKVLVIDDDPMVARAIGRTLRSHKVTLAPSADAALERIRGGETFDLVLCDVMMPGMDGVGFYGALERERATLLPKLVFMTAGVFSTEIARFIEESSVPCMQKPVSADMLYRLVRARQVPGSSAPAPPTSRA